MNKKNCKHGVAKYTCGQCEKEMLRRLEIGHRIEDCAVAVAGMILMAGIGLILAVSFYQTFNIQH